MDILRTAVGLANVGLVVVVMGVLAAGGAVLWLFRDRLKEARALLVMILMLMAVPIGARLVQERAGFFSAADTEIKVLAVQVERVEGKTVVYLTLSEPAVAYLEYREEGALQAKIIVAEGAVERRTGHTFVIGKIGRMVGQAVLVVEGKRMEGQLIDVK